MSAIGKSGPGMRGEAYQFYEFSARDQACRAVADRLANLLRAALNNRGEAGIMLSGGSTPGPAYRMLSQRKLPWHRVKAGLVDDRWVEPGQPGSNESLIREELLRGPARKASFTGLKTSAPTPFAGLAEVEKKLRVLPNPFDVCVMGMGLDGHTASWFPGSEGLRAALLPDNPGHACAINATGCPVAGEYPQRISLSLAAVMDGRDILLFITGAEKRRVFEAAMDKPVMDAPVRALSFAGPRLSVYWAP